MDDIKLEELEKRYFDYIIVALTQDLNRVISGLNSRLKILGDWKHQFQKTARQNYKSSDLDAGAERIFHHLFQPMFRFPNSCPIGSDMMYITDDAVIHIEVKTTLVTNPDYIGRIQLGRNQISFGLSKVFKPNLPTNYCSEEINLPTLTYAIQIIHEHMQSQIYAFNVICIPNGQLYRHYGSGILKAGKAGWKKARDTRYKYAEQPLFILLSKRDNKEIYRIEILLLDKNFSIKQLTGKDLNLKPYRIIE